VVSINYWGLSDRQIWIESAGLIDEEYQPKPVFETLKRLIKGEWMTQPFTAYTDENGRINFSGFFGKYEIVVPQKRQKYTSFEFHLAADRQNSLQFTLG